MKLIGTWLISREVQTWVVDPVSVGTMWRFREVGSVISDSFPFLVANLVSLAIISVEAMTWMSNLEVRSGSLVSTLSSNNTNIGKLEWQPVPRISEFDPSAEATRLMLIVQGLRLQLLLRQIKWTWNHGPSCSYYVGLSKGPKCLQLALKHQRRLLSWVWSG